MILKAKKNLHECKYHLDNLLKAKHFEEVEINFVAFVNSARNITFVLQKEFKNDPQFITWYGNSQKEKVICKCCGKAKEISYNPEEGTKRYEMKNDELCNFFFELRSQIAKEGSNNLDSLFRVKSMNSNSDYLDKPVDASLVLNSKGAYYHVHKGGSKEDLIPAFSKTTKIIPCIYMYNYSGQHLGQKIKNPNLCTIIQLYYTYLENLLEEWTGIMNGIV
jgi:hypothetical protein